MGRERRLGEPGADLCGGALQIQVAQIGLQDARRSLGQLGSLMHCSPKMLPASSMSILRDNQGPAHGGISPRWQCQGRKMKDFVEPMPKNWQRSAHLTLSDFAGSERWLRQTSPDTGTFRLLVRQESASTDQEHHS